MCLERCLWPSNVFLKCSIPLGVVLLVTSTEDPFEVTLQDVHRPLDWVHLLHVPFVLSVVRAAAPGSSPEFGKMSQEHCVYLMPIPDVQ